MNPETQHCLAESAWEHTEFNPQRFRRVDHSHLRTLGLMTCELSPAAEELARKVHEIILESRDLLATRWKKFRELEQKKYELNN